MRLFGIPCLPKKTKMSEIRWNTIFKNVVSMLVKRGYKNIPDRIQRIEKNNPSDNFTSDDDMFMFYPQENTKKNSVFVYFYRRDKMNIEAIKEFISWIEQNGWKHSIIVYKAFMTSTTKKVIDHLHNFHIELFESKEFMYDLTALAYYCVHERIDDSATIDTIVKKYGMKLPKILHTDPVCRFFDFRKGDILRIHRKNNTIAYRIVR